VRRFNYLEPVMIEETVSLLDEYVWVFVESKQIATPMRPIRVANTLGFIPVPISTTVIARRFGASLLRNNRTISMTSKSLPWT